ncbi:Brp/Blh family beta-carotene 15,15'-dioxygenase [Rhodoflexus sp.]
MNTSLSQVEQRHNLLLLPVTLLIIVARMSNWWQPPMDYLVFALVMLLTGLPHGALDHLLHIRHGQKDTVNSRTMLRFLLRYLSLIAIYALVWVLLPTLSLLIFILLSCYHFGQSQWYYFFPAGSAVGRLLYLNWGMAVLSLILCWNIDASEAIIAPVVPELIRSEGWAQFLEIAWIVPLLLLVPPLLFLLVKFFDTQLRIAVVSELLTLAAVALAARYSGVLMAFVIYFGIWHSTKSLMTITRSFQAIQPEYTLWRVYKEALPFTFISVIGIGLLLMTTVYEWIPINPLMLFFIALSVLTLPHMIVLELVYERRS